MHLFLNKKLKKLLIIFFLILLSYDFLNYKNLFDKYGKINGIDWSQGFQSENGIQQNSEYSMNYDYIMNNNLGQYSSHLIIDENNKTIITIEAYVKFNFKYIKSFGGKENFTCILKFFNVIIKNFDMIELEATDSPVIPTETVFKLVFKLNLTKTGDLNLNSIRIAVIWKYDFKKSLDHDSFMKQINFTQPLVLPYSLIKYQIPSIMKIIEPRLPSVSFCVHFSYSVTKNLIDWFDFHLKFGVREIMIYDGTDNNTLKKELQNKYGYDERIQIIPYKIDFDSLCSENVLYKQFVLQGIVLSVKLKTILAKSCKDFFDKEFRDKVDTRSSHEKITVNDCYGILSKKHEFIGYYDLDEYVFPRSFSALKYFNDTGKLNNDQCNNNSSSICELNPFTNSASNVSSNPLLDGNYLYNYLNYLIQFSKNKDRSKLVSIAFPHAAVIESDCAQSDLMSELEYIINKIESTKNKTNLFPLSLFLREPKTNEGHNFIIENDDVEYLKYLQNSYKNSIQCFQEDYLKNIKNISSNLIRNTYYLTEGMERMGKKIHYYKNVKTLWVHWAWDVEKIQGTWTCCDDNSLEGGFVLHFRENIRRIWKANYTGSIRKLNFDFEYVYFLLKHFTNYCKI